MHRVGSVSQSGLLVSIAAALVGCKTDRDKQASGPPSPAASSKAPSPADLAPLRPALEAAPAPAGEESTSGEPVTVGFDWGPPCRVPAIQDAEKDGARSRFAFDVVLERSSTGLVMKLDKLRVVSAPGGTRDARAEVERAVAVLGGAIPPIAVAESGESLGATDIDKAIDATLAVIRSTDAGGSVAIVEKMMKSPTFKEAFQQKAGETWAGWVGAWVQLEIAPHSERRETFDLPSALGTFRDVPLTTKHLGTVRDAPSLVLLSTEQVIEGPELAAAISGFTQDIANRAGALDTKIEFRSARKVDRITVAIDAARGRPHRSRHETTIELQGKRRQQVKDTAFDWSRATGCATAASSAGSGSAQH